MARHFLTLYLLIVVTLAAASWGQERLWEAYLRQSTAEDAGENRLQAAALTVVVEQLHSVPASGRQRFVAELAARTGLDFELLAFHDIAGRDTLARLARGELAFMNATDGEAWMLKRLAVDGRVLAFRSAAPEARRGVFEWALAFVFYAAIALVIMFWLWPLTRDLQRLERSTMNFGNRNWVFDADIRPGSQIYPLAEAFRRMASRIDSLISSHKDMSNAVAHEIKTPLARMRFEIEMARAVASPEKLVQHLKSINTDIAELNAFVTAALDYAILERAEVALNVAEHDFTLILPAVTESVGRGAPVELEIGCEVEKSATRVSCDVHLMETVLRNLLYNAIRHARRTIRVVFSIERQGIYQLQVDDDGPGIPEADRQRVFGSFVQLGEPGAGKAGYGLGLAIVKRVVEWHGGQVAITRSALGGASFSIRWPVAQT
jgi:two-component system, OmpR family, sensor kinase